MAKFSIFYPIHPNTVNQGWGTNGEYYRTNGINILGHNGIDFRASHGQPVYAAHDGTAYYEVDNSQGHGVVVICDKPYDYKNGLAFFKTIYWHFCDPIKEPSLASPIYKIVGENTSRGVPVKAGDLVGYADSTGFSQGDHLHFGLKPITTGTPPTYGDSPDVNIGAWINLEQNNGYLGAVDPTPYFNGNNAVDANKVIANEQQQVSLLQKLLNLLITSINK